MSAIIYGNINKAMSDRNIRTRNAANESSSSDDSGGGKKKPTRDWSESKTTFSTDPLITQQLRDEFINQMPTPIGKKYVSFMLTPENLAKVYKDFHREARLDFNDIADAFTLASLRAAMIVEGRSSVSAEQVKGVRATFRNVFSQRSLDRAEMQRTSQGVLYWTMLRDLGLETAQKNNDFTVIARSKAEASTMMTAMGLGAQTHKLGIGGFERK